MVPAGIVVPDRVECVEPGYPPVGRGFFCGIYGYVFRVLGWCPVFGCQPHWQCGEEEE